MSAKPIPETANRQDWPRLVAAADRDKESRLRVLEAGGSASGTFLIDDGTAAASGVFSFNDGGA